MFRKLVFLMCLGSVPVFSLSQTSVEHIRAVQINYAQIKDVHNYGLVFRGFGLGYAAGWSWVENSRTLGYRYELGLTVLMTHEIPAADFRLLPICLDYRLPLASIPGLSIGPALSVEYRYQFNPDLQSGHAYWFSHISLGGSLNWQFRLLGEKVSLEAGTSLFGLASRPPVYYDPYLWKISVPLMFKYMNQDFHPGSWNRYNVTSLELKWVPGTKSRIGFAYQIDYMGYYKNPQITLLDHSIKIIFLPKSKKS